MSPPRRRRPATRTTQRRRHAPTRDFWGTDDAQEHDPPAIRPSEEPSTLVRSLGPPPFPGGEVAQHYFDAVYDRAAALAVALAAAAGLLDTTPDDDGPDVAHPLGEDDDLT